MSLKELGEAAVAIFIVLGTLYIHYMLGVGMLTDIGVDVRDSQTAEYRKAVVLESLVSVSATEEELGKTSGTSKYDYDRRRGHIPVEFFTQPKQDEGIGYQVKNGHCYIGRVAGLDGEKFAFNLRKLSDPAQNAQNHKKIDEECVRRQSATYSISRTKTDADSYISSGPVKAPVLLVREDRHNPPLPVMLYVYRVQ